VYRKDGKTMIQEQNQRRRDEEHKAKIEERSRKGTGLYGHKCHLNIL
jgi:hypothetical protein